MADSRNTTETGLLQSSEGELSEAIDEKDKERDRKSEAKVMDGSLTASPLWYVYILVCRDGTFYTGYTGDLSHRLRMHNQQKGAKYTRSRTPVYFVYHEVFVTAREARSREWAIKHLTREQKLQLILSHPCCLLETGKNMAVEVPSI